mmetsp:Transcript_66997/g.160534  ORF Transcript_66997/g.160534 Transcript_66997/m.160534 type:complete len:872 (+) Transcript_66997:136-2751(+)
MAMVSQIAERRKSLSEKVAALLPQADLADANDATWQVTIHSLKNLGEAEYRVGDLSMHVAQAVSGASMGNSFCGQPVRNPFEACMRPAILPDSNSEPDFSSTLSMGTASTEVLSLRTLRLGKVAVEIQVGDVKKRTAAVEAYREQEVQVEQTLLVPAPMGDTPMTVRVLRVGHVQSASLIGQNEEVKAATLEAEDCQVELELALERNGNDAGTVRLNIEPCDDAFVPVAATPKVRRRDRLTRMYTRIVKVRNKIMDKYFSDGKSHLSEPLMSSGSEAPDWTFATLTVAIEKVVGLEAKANKPSFRISLDGHEFKASHFRNRHTRELTFVFPVARLDTDLKIYCYDELGAFRNFPVGRILLPLVDLLSTPGAEPTISSVCAALQPISDVERRLVCRFMPVSEAGDGSHIPGFVDSFRPGSMPGSAVFGQVALHLSLNVGPPSLSAMQCYVDSMTRGIFEAKAIRDHRHDDNEPAEGEEEPTLISVLRNIDVMQTVRYLNRLQALALMWRHQRGFVRWIRKEEWRGPFAAVCWLMICLSGHFPPPIWAWPVCIWFGLLANGLIFANHRRKDWDDHSAYAVFNEEAETASLQKRIDLFKKGVHEIERNAQTLVSFLERVSNLFSFADVPASFLWCVGSGIVTVVASFVGYIIVMVDPSGNWTWGILGSGLLLVISRRPKREMKRFQTASALGGKNPNPLQPLVDLLRPLSMFNSVMACVPDMGQLAHRYIATRIQCVTREGTGRLHVTIHSARGLRAADWASGSSDPYCTCQIFGKPESRFKTDIIYRCRAPYWEHSQDLEYDVGDDLLFQVWDYDLGKTHDFLGRVILKYDEYCKNGFSGELNLREASGAPGTSGAVLHVDVRVVLSVDEAAS